QGKRWGRRGPDKRIIEAYGFDLSPLAQRLDEFIRLAVAARQEREVANALRKRKTVVRRAIRQAGETLAELGQMPEGWHGLALETARLSALAGNSSRDLASIVEGLETCRVQAEAWLKEAADWCQSSPQGLKNEPHTTDTKLTSNLKDTVIALQDSNRLPGTSRNPSLRPSSGTSP